VNDRLRIGDADRETAARELGEHFALGRITADEHAERLEQIWSARTAADLAPAFRDLPRPRAAQQPPRSTAASKPVRRDRGWELPRLPFLFKLLLAIVVVWWGLHHVLFLLIGAVVWFVVVRRFVHRRRWHGRWQGRWQGRSGSWDRRHYSAGWH
jgi:Flp pilus assembly protein TadB